LLKRQAANQTKAKMYIVSRTGELFRDRVQAGRLLAAALEELRGEKAVVLGIPRGGVVVAKEIARGLGADMDVVLSRKLVTPGQTELAMGSISEDGNIFLNEEIVQTLGITSRQIEQEKTRQLEEIKRRTQLFRKVLPKTPIEGRAVIVTDDGLATGATMQSALWAVRQEKPCRLIVAVPVATGEALESVAAVADEVVCLRQPPNFFAVGQFYMRFYQVEDEDVLDLMKEEAEKRKKRSETGK